MKTNIGRAIFHRVSALCVSASLMIGSVMVPAAHAAIANGSQQVIVVEPFILTSDLPKQLVFTIYEDPIRGFRLGYRHLHVLQQLAELTPEQREQLRSQIREHRQRMHEQQQRAQNIAPVSAESAGGTIRPQSLSPEERYEFRQWMRQRQERR